MKRKTLAMLLVISTFALTACGGAEGSDKNTERGSETITDTEGDSEAGGIQKSEISDGEVALEVSDLGNPLVGDDGTGEYVYGGDPAVLVDGDTVYLYTGHDVSKSEGYEITEYLCYSTKDLVNWKAEGSVMKADRKTVSWANSDTNAWAAQVAKYKDKYYLYFCTWDKTSDGKQSIGVAVSDSPTGPFEDLGQPLVSGKVTEPETSGWNDIDPTVWIETDDQGEEHRYLAWGNGLFYICELNEDMVSVKDLNGDGQITSGSSTADADIINMQATLSSFTEAPWLYRRQDENGNYYGDYYLFYAAGWREKMAYATTDKLMDGKWTSKGTLTYPTATSNTNHMAVFDFKGKTYFIYHNGSLPGGSGFRRSACIAEVNFEEDGSILGIPETAAGISGTISTIELADGNRVAHDFFNNSSADGAYPYKDIPIGIYDEVEEDYETPEEAAIFGPKYDRADAYWVIRSGKADRTNAAYVSIESENKPGLFITANEDGSITLAQEAVISDDTKKMQTFHTVVGLADKEGVSFESVSQPGKYVTFEGDVLKLTDGSNAEASTFYVKEMKAE